MYPPSSLIATGILLPLLGMVAVGLRFIVRLRSKAFLGIDDWTILAGWFIVCGMAACQIAGAVLGQIGREGHPGAPNKLDYILVVIEKPAYGLIKLSVLLFYRRIFATRAFRVYNDIVIVVIVSWAIAFLGAEVFACGTHPAAQWSKHPPPGQCINQPQLLLWFAITDVIGDIIVLSMPYRCIMKLQLDKRRKIGLAVIFMLGTLALVGGIIRLGIITKTTIENRGSSTAKQGLNGPTAPPIFWTIFEVAVAVVAACLPPLAPLIRKTPTPRRFAHSIRHVLSSHSSKKQSIRLSEKPPKSHEDHPTKFNEDGYSGDSSIASKIRPVEGEQAHGTRWDLDLV